jgi:AbiV family abortive infection protein
MKLKKEELLDLFSSSLDNAFSMYNAAKKILDDLGNEKYPSLGLAELALEELGKSYSCLAFYSHSENLNDWKEFWKEWRNHDLKAHRAFFYEFFCLIRVELKYDDKPQALPFPSSQEKFSKEKEMSFYVDINKENRNIHKPEKEISDLECIRRVTSLLGLFNAAFYVRDWMLENNNEDFRNAISDYAFQTISTEIYQQDVNNVLQQMKKGNEQYDSGLNKISELFNSNFDSKEK